MTASIFAAHRALAYTLDFNDECHDEETDGSLTEFGPFLSNGRAVWTDNATLLWCEPRGDWPPLEHQGVGELVEMASSAPALAMLRRASLVKALESTGWVTAGGAEFRSSRVLAAMASLQGRAVEIAVVRYKHLVVLVVRAGRRGAAITQLEHPPDLLKLPAVSR